MFYTEHKFFIQFGRSGAFNFYIFNFTVLCYNKFDDYFSVYIITRRWNFKIFINEIKHRSITSWELRLNIWTHKYCNIIVFQLITFCVNIKPIIAFP